MHPWVILPKPGDCPVCHMELVLLDPAKFTGKVAIDPLVVQNIGVRIAPVVTGPLMRRIRTVGTVDYDETGVRDVNVKVPGWIEKLYVDYLGAEVKKGEPLFEFYSPDLYSTQEEYLLNLENVGKIGADFVPGSHIGPSQRAAEDGGVFADGPAGTLGIHHQSILHRRGQSTASGMRYMLKYNYWRTTSRSAIGKRKTTSTRAPPISAATR